MIEFKLPELGEGVESGQVIEVFIAPGDKVSAEQPLLEIETDKAAVEIPSPADGTILDVYVSSGELVKINQLLLKIEDGSKDSTLSKEYPESQTQDPPPKEELEQKRELPPKELSERIEISKSEEVSDKPNIGKHVKVPASPSVRRLAREIGVDLLLVRGTGAGGRILEKDVKLYAKNIMNSASSSPVSSKVEFELPDFSRWGETKTESFSTVRKITAERLSIAWNAPHVTQFDKADVSELESLRKLNKDRVRAAGGNLTITPILVKVVSSLLPEFPKFNSSIDMEQKTIIYKEYVNIAVAVDTDRGLLVPVIKNCDKKEIVEIAVELNNLSSKARDKKISPDELQGSTFTVTNLGGIGGISFTPIINPPEVAILGVSKSSIEPIYIDGEFKPRLMLPLQLSYDHRIIDGVEAAKFLRRICETLEKPFKVILEP